MGFQKSNLHYTRDITPERVTSGGIRLGGLAFGQHRNAVAMASRWKRGVYCNDSFSDTNPVYTMRLPVSRVITSP